jgi:glycerol-3-phosphate O-acyltransferase
MAGGRLVRQANARLYMPVPEFALRNRREIIESLLSEPEITAYLDRRPAAEREAHLKNARRYAREIGPRFSAFFYFRLGRFLARTLLRMHYRIRVVDLEDNVLSGVPPDATVVLVSNHRSNFDPLVITYLASQRSTIALSAGEWARLWPLHHLVRAAGGFVVDRDADDELYKRVLAAYIRVSARSGLHQAVFPEGELSRDGRMSQPKLGFLNYICRACCPQRDIVFIPVGINYDRIPEDRRLANAEGSFENPKASFLILSSLRYIATVLALPFRRQSHRFGLAGVCFDAPLSLNAWLDSQRVDIAELENAGRNEWLPELAKELMRRCARRIPVTPVPLAAAAIAGQPNQASWDRASLCDAMKQVGNRLAAKGAFVYLPDGMPAASRFALEMLQHNRLLEADGGGAFRINESERTVLQHYANSIEHLLT